MRMRAFPRVMVMPGADIASAHQRKQGAITSRLVKLGLIEEKADARW